MVTALYRCKAEAVEKLGKAHRAKKPKKKDGQLEEPDEEQVRLEQAANDRAMLLNLVSAAFKTLEAIYAPEVVKAVEQGAPKPGRLLDKHAPAGMSTCCVCFELTGLDHDMMLSCRRCAKQAACQEYA